MDAAQDAFEVSIDGRRQLAHHTWFRGENCNFNPDAENMRSNDAVLRHVLAGWLPSEPLIDRKTNIVAFGSCFAEHISTYLGRRDYNIATAKDGGHGDAYVVRFGEGMVNTFVIRQQFEWAFENRIPAQDLWPSYDARAFGYDEQIRLSTRALFDKADIFIITLGLSEIWYDEVTGGVFWRVVPTDKYDPARHKFRVSSVAENVDNVKAIYRLIRQYRPSARVIFTLSPIPLMATFRPVSCITANSASKAILRAAVDQAYREINEPQAFFYWPSYEIVMDVFADRWEPDRRHIKAPILDFVMTLFEYAWCTGPRSDQHLQQAWMAATSPPASSPPPAPRKSLSSKIRREGLRLIGQISAVGEKVRANGRSSGTPEAR
jgi:hypothetical protein